MRIFIFLCLFISFSHAADEKDLLPKPGKRTERRIEGWLVKVDDRLLQSNNKVGERALQLLEAQLANIRSVVSSNSLEKLQKVVIVLDLDHGKLKPAQYHPSAGWLEGHGYARDLEKCVHIPLASNFANARHNSEQPWCVMHELAHAYNDQVLGFANGDIKQAYERYKASGHGDSVLFIAGGKKKHYALLNHKEFFAEMTEAYFGMNDFFPFNRGELKTEEPETYELLQKIWGPLVSER
ncbi:MAG: metallopeptidase [Kiritimatiellae bacterium]|nr:metallopeptidase [Kiritimatiellia bacterium]MDD5522374.1 metallopeptidase [Kiritimatiellia bacterium]